MTSSVSANAFCSIRFAGVQNLPVDVLSIQTGDHRTTVSRIGEVEKAVTLGSAALDVSRHADRVGLSKRQRESMELLVADVAGDVSYIDLHKDTFSLSMAIIERRSIP